MRQRAKGAIPTPGQLNMISVARFLEICRDETEEDGCGE